MRGTVTWLSVIVAAALLGAVALDGIVRTLVAETAPVVGPIGQEALPDIVVSRDTAPARTTIYQAVAGFPALAETDILGPPPPGVVNALLTKFDDDAEHEGDHEGRFWTLGVVFEARTVAIDAFHVADARVLSNDWRLGRELQVAPSERSELDFGDQGAYYTWGSDYGHPLYSAYVWRVENVLLLAVDFHPYDRTERLLRLVAGAMDERARRNIGVHAARIPNATPDGAA